MTRATPLTCACGDVQLEVDGDPIIAAECHCDSCRAAGGRLAALPAAASVLEPNGGTPYVMYRKDRVRFLAGTERLREFRLGPAATTRRIVASCCNTPICLEFHNGHWLSLYGRLWPREALPPMELRTMTSDRSDSAGLADDIPNRRHQSVRFFARLLGAWIAMGFKVPKLAFVKGEIQA